MLTAQANLAVSLRSTGRIAEAGRLLDDAYTRLRSTVGPTNPDTVAVPVEPDGQPDAPGRRGRRRSELDACSRRSPRCFGARHPYTLVCEQPGRWPCATSAVQDGGVRVRRRRGRRAAGGARARPSVQLGADNNAAVLRRPEGRPGGAAPGCRPGGPADRGDRAPTTPTRCAASATETARQAASGGAVSIAADAAGGPARRPDRAGTPERVDAARRAVRAPGHRPAPLLTGPGADEHVRARRRRPSLEPAQDAGQHVSTAPKWAASGCTSTSAPRDPLGQPAGVAGRGERVLRAVPQPHRCPVMRRGRTPSRDANASTSSIQPYGPSRSASA